MKKIFWLSLLLVVGIGIAVAATKPPKKEEIKIDQDTINFDLEIAPKN